MSTPSTLPSGETLHDTFVKALDRLPAPLADDAAREGLMAIADALPAALTAGPLGLELRMRGPATVDFFAACGPGDPSWTAFRDHLRHPTGRAGWADQQRSDDLADVLDRWQSGRSELPRVARYLLIECDAPSAPGGPLAPPSIFLAPRGARDNWRPGEPTPPPNAFHRHPDTTVVAAAELAGVWPDPVTAAELRAVVDSLPDDGDVFAVGAMIGRDAGASLRIAIRRLTARQIHAVLTVAGRGRQADVLAEWVDQAPADQLDIAFEVGPGAESRVGLEMSPWHDWKSARLEGWPELLNFVVDRGVASADRAKAVPGLVDADGDPLWGLAHVKVAADTSGLLPVSKLYVGLLHRDAGGA